MARKIIALTGEMGSGKDTVAKYLREKYGAQSFRFSDVLRTLLRELELPITRENLTGLSQALRALYGENVLALSIARKASVLPADTLLVIDGIRRESDLLPFREQGEIMLIYIDAPLETRFERIQKRMQNEDEAEKTLEEFKGDHELETEIQVPLLREKATAVIDNSGTLEELFAQVEEYLEKLAVKQAL
ncbi:MAG: hypothetical protein A2808_02905 [Candidatus Moranbacteria bacterium RIFCSPHIGHO2_01_FULL_55_24]|nr:MAG: hypothetical protein A2808_02905 [Candidatus Moranbacteria bacterium RIFCSPHIGHO2_01_FULL_55_24]